MLESLQLLQNSDGGWPYRPGGSSWTEPTIYSLLAGYATHDAGGRAQALNWLRATQRRDGGWSPKVDVAQSTWVTALVALLPPEDLGAAVHTGAIRWLLNLTAANDTLLSKARSWLNREKYVADPSGGWPWFPGTAGWATPTAISTLALALQNRRKADPVLKERIGSGRHFLLTHRCADGGWNHGSFNVLGVDAVSYPETTGTALLALSGSDAAALAPSVNCAEAWWKECPSCEAACWLSLALRANGRPQQTTPPHLKPRTVQDLALRAIATAGDRGLELFIV